MTDKARKSAIAAWNTRTLQGSAALPSEAQIEAGADCLRQAGTRGLNAEEAAVEVYTAMRATTPTAPRACHKRGPGGSICYGTIPADGEDCSRCGASISPTAPVQDDDAELRDIDVPSWLRNLPACHPPAEGWTDDDRAQLNRIADALSPTPETGLVEALREARQFVVIQGPGDAFPDVLAMIDAALSNVLPDEGAKA